MIPNLILKLLLFGLFLEHCNSLDDYDEVVLEDAQETRSRILMINGNIWLHAGKDRNITFKTNGDGKIFVDDTDVSRLPDTAQFQDALQRIEHLQTIQTTLSTRSDSQLSYIRILLNAMSRTVLAYRNLTNDVASLKKWKLGKITRDIKRRGLLVKMTRQIIKTTKLMAMNACDRNKCENGGTCIPRVGEKYYCLCPPHFMGEKCEADVNECEVYSGTSAGCQNNGTCVNHHGGFQCNCTDGFHGPLCQYQMSSCSRSYELCGAHGHCVDLEDSKSKTKYKCICDYGYKSSQDPKNPTCIDVDECESNPCHPGVDCINLPGSFQCSGCPKGYKTEGNRCVDINECEAEISPCDPLVQCVNSIGSFHCEPCPAGYTGDSKSKTCTKTDLCTNNNCHPLAKCKQTEDSLIAGGYACYCPDGYTGDGLGANGCIRSNSTESVCKNNDCLNGATCRPLNETVYQCDCPENYLGKYCELANPCSPNPCQNEGECSLLEGGEQETHCKCPKGFYGVLCEQEELTCGAHFSEPNGTFIFKKAQTAYQICDFVFEISAQNSALKLTFKNFDEFSDVGSGLTDCAKTLGNLTLYDGPTDNSRLFATFCGDRSSTHAPMVEDPITMTSSFAMMRFRGTTGTFEIKWQTVERKCGYRTTKPEGILTVPTNKQDIVCEWFISAPATKVVEIDIPQVTMHSGDDVKCEQNSLEIFDGYSSYDIHRISQICGTTQVPQTVRSTGPYLSVSFVSNMLTSAAGLETIRGFDIKYKFVDPDRTCGADITNVNKNFEFSGSIESPNFGSLYPPNMDCTWKIDGSIGDNSTTDKGLGIKLTIDTFDVPSEYHGSYSSIGSDYDFSYGILSRPRLHHWNPRLNHIGHPLYQRRYIYSSSCVHDSLKIYSGSGSLIIDGCNPHRPAPEILIPNPVAVLTFHSNGKTQGKGFKIQYDLVCQSTFTGNGTIQSWNYPHGGKAGKCTYIIQAPKTHAIKIKFTTIGLKVLPMSECFYSTKTDYPNYIELEGGRTDNLQFNKQYPCAKYPFVEENQLTVSAIRPLKIVVNSDGNEKFKGMSMEYQTVDVGCGGVYSTMVGEISSPNYPEKYLPHMHCVYEIYVSWSKSVKLTFDTFDMEVTATEDCKYDRVEIYANYRNETSHGKLLGRFCGSMLPPVIYSPVNTMTIVFVSDRSVSGQGFNAKFEAVSRETTCDRTFTEPSGEIIFAKSEEKFDKCLYHIAVNDNQKVVLKMNNMSLPCYSSRLKFRNGPTEESPAFPSLYGDSEVCDTYPMPVIRTFSNRALIIFTSTDSRNAWFNISYEVISNGCGGRVDGLSGSVAAPQYPLGDRRNLKCEWTIAVALGNKVRFTLAALDDLKSSDESGFCPVFAANRLDVYDSTAYGSKLLKRFCQKEVAAEPINSDDNEIVLRYSQANGFREGKIYGFMGHFTTICQGITLNSLSGSIQTPGYPHKVYTPQYCTWTIQVPKGNRIQVKFHHFSIEKLYMGGMKDCIGNFLKIDDVDLGEAEIKVKNSVNVTSSVNKYCSIAQPLSIRSKHNTMKLTYVSSQMATNQFWLSWTTSGCSREIRAPRNLRISKLKFDNEVDEYECKYQIVAPVGKKIRVKIDRFDILKTVESDQDCVYSENGAGFYGAAVFMGSSNASGVAQKSWCKAVKEEVYDSHTNEVFLYFSLKKSHLIESSHDVIFNATVEFLDTNGTVDACGGIVDLKPTEYSVIQSPGFPDTYPAATQCQWLVRAPDGYHIEYSLDEYHSPNYHEQKEGRYVRWGGLGNFTCQHMLPFTDGMLTIYNSNDTKTGKILEKFCQESSETQTFEVFSDQSVVGFVGASNMFGRKSGEEAKQRNGFLMKVRAICGGIVYADSEQRSISMYHNDDQNCSMVIKKRDPDDDEIRIQIAEYNIKADDTFESDEDVIEIEKDEAEKEYLELKNDEKTLKEYTAENQIKISVQHTADLHSAVILYSTDSRRCGGEVRHIKGIIENPIKNREKPLDCYWTVRNTPGNEVSLEIKKLLLPSSDNCTDSYVEIREFNSTGRLIRRICEDESIENNFSKLLNVKYSAEILWMHLRYRVPEEEEYMVEPEFRVEFKKDGKTFNSRIISKPVTEGAPETISRILSAGTGNGFLVRFRKMMIFHKDSYIRFTLLNANLREFKGTSLPSEQFFDDDLMYFDANVMPDEDYEISWEPVGLDYLNRTKVEKAAKTYDCGGELQAGWEWNDITNPRPVGQTYGYEENLHCRWILKRPMFSGIEVKFDFLELENDDQCQYDYVAIKLMRDLRGEDVDDISDSSTMRHCSLARSNTTMQFSINKAIHIHFVTDRSRYGRGFRLQYRLTCNSFDHIPARSIFETEFTSPNWPMPLNRDLTCQWTIVLESNRKLEVNFLNMDISEESPCSDDNVLILSNHIGGIFRKLYSSDDDSSKYCGKLGTDAVNFTSSQGRIFVKYTAKATQLVDKGFRLKLREVQTECPSGIMYLDENTPKRVIRSPEYPEAIPHSVECEYLLAAPNGHRIMLTFDPDQFDMEIQRDGKCSDYIEIRDGPSSNAQRIGRFCGNHPPSSIYSTSNFLYLRLHTDQYSKSKRFLATYEIATCGGTIIVDPSNKTTHITSPGYPDPFKSPLNCEWTVRSPNSHMVMTKVEHMWIFYNMNCTIENLSILDGNSTSPALMKPICNPKNAPVDWVRSSGNQVTVKFVSNSTTMRAGRQYCQDKKCGFDISAKLSETKCGGKITDATGRISTPGFPGRLLPHVKCTWEFYAKPGFVYELKLNWTETPGWHKYDEYAMRPAKIKCFGDLQLKEGVKLDSSFNAHFTKKFCEGHQSMTFSTDFASLVYDDSVTREIMGKEDADLENDPFYAPFDVEYLMLPASSVANDEACTFSVNSNKTFVFGSDDQKQPGVVVVPTICHVTVEKPNGFGTTWIRIENYTNAGEQLDFKTCLQWDSYIDISSESPILIDRQVCESTAQHNVSDMAYINSKYDLIISQAFRNMKNQKFSVTVEFQKCGGLITSPNSGEITSPNYGPESKYLANSRCQWLLEAPEGQVVKIKITAMKIEFDYECEKDHLIIGEGKQWELNTIHEYCHDFNGDNEQKLEERFRVVKSRGRWMTLLWHSDGVGEDLGWKLEYEFVNEQDTCGYHTTGLSGTIHSPHFGVSDYDNNLECIWDVQVPLGYHINVKFENFDVETSEKCSKDQLTISEEHSSRANSPLGDYYFLFQDEEKHTPMCGIETPTMFESESNRIRLNFTTDSKTTAKGWMVNWEATCGTVYSLNHGVISSPNYPEGYPNERQNCSYLITTPKDQPNAVIALKITDFDLSNMKTDFDRYPCEEDYVQIIDAVNQRVLYTLCGGQTAPEDVITIKGTAAIVFNLAPSHFWPMKKGAMKNNRGFQITYNINRCGGEIELIETQLTQSIQSPAFPLSYAHNLDCVWNISTTSDRHISVKFLEFDFEELEDCSSDSLEIFDTAEEGKNETSLAKLCGGKDRIPAYRITSKGNQMSIRLITDATVNRGGFKLVVSASLGPKSGCGGSIQATDDWQTLTSPKDENGNYPGSLHCGWMISGPTNSQIQIRLDSIDTEHLTYPPGDKPKPECVDSLAIYDGQEHFSPVLAADICTSETPAPTELYSSHRHVFVAFETDEDGSGKGFNLSYRILQQECGGWLQAVSEEKTLLFKSKLVGEDDRTGRTSQRCRFMIQGTKNEPVIMQFHQFNITSKQGDCSDSYVEIRDVGSLNECQHPGCARSPGQRKTTRICGNNLPPAHISNTNTIQVIVSAQIEVETRSEFKFSYQLLDNCNRTIDVNTWRSGRLTTPNWPNQYNMNDSCLSTLETNNRKMLIVFEKFTLEFGTRDTSCDTDYLEITQSFNSTTRYCGSTLPPTIYTDGKDLSALFKSDYSVVRGGYAASYYSVAREFDDFVQFSDSYDLEGVVTNIGYPNGYKKSMTQIFTIRPPGSHDCTFTFVEVNLGVEANPENCAKQEEEYLDVELHHKQESKTARVRDCSMSPQTFKTTISGDDQDRYVKITFKSDDNPQNDGRGFRIEWKCDNFNSIK